MSRSIIPIYDESESLLIETRKEMIDFFKESEKYNLTRLRIVSSGDARRLMFGYADKKMLDQIKEENKEIEDTASEISKSHNFYLPDIVSFSKNTFLLSSGEYEVNENKIDSATLIGYHRQKTRMITEDDLLIFGDTTISYLMLKKAKRGSSCNVIVEKGSCLTLDNVILDGITIVVKDGSTLKLKKADFRGALNGVIQEGSGKVEVCDDVTFVGMAYEYNFEVLNKKTSINVVDYTNIQSIENFTRKSKAKKFAVYQDLDFRSEDIMKIETPLEFYNDTEMDIEIKANNIIVKEEFRTSGIVISGQIEISDSEKCILSLESLIGRVVIKDSKNILLENMTIYPSKKTKAIELASSKVALVGVTIEGETKKSIDSGCVAVELSSSKLELQNVRMSKLQEAIVIKREKVKVEVDEDEEEKSPNSIFFNGWKVSDAFTVLNSLADIEEISGKKLIIKDVHDGFILKGVQMRMQDILFENIVGQSLNLNYSAIYVDGSQSLMKNVGTGIVLSGGTAAEIFNLKFEDIQEEPAISIENSRFIARKPKFENVQVAIHIQKNGLFINDNAEFFHVKHPILKAHGAKEAQNYTDFLTEQEIEGEDQ